MIYYVITLLSQIYCEGPILEAVQNAHLFPDSKHFVDMSLKHDPVTTLKRFHALGNTVQDNQILMKFVNEHFDPPGSELEDCQPEDWVPFPANYLKIKDFHLRRWALSLHRLWRELCRRVRDKVREHQELYSLLYVPHPFIIPGGRFREFYYWDSYWILKGLLFSEMYDTARGMIWNLAHLVDNHGFVPNGGRVYYLLRSQPPLLTLMAYDYYLATGDTEFLQNILPLLEKEYRFWLIHRGTAHYHNHSTEHNALISQPAAFNFYQYRAKMKTPRPESYREDLELVLNISDTTERRRVWSDIASAAETGWDFSSRWFSRSGPEAGQLKSIRTASIVPVDLNAFMCMNSRLLANMYEITGNYSKVLIYQSRYEQAKQQIEHMHWNETDGTWYDYDLVTQRHVNIYYISNTLPLFARCYDDETAPKRVYDNLRKVGALDFSRGLPTSLEHDSSQQWDSVNAWAPCVHMVTLGAFALRFGVFMLCDEGFVHNHIILKRNRAYIQSHAMFEKYNVSNQVSDSTAAGGGGEYEVQVTKWEMKWALGGGGEYEVQTGFGWTNGVILDLLEKFGDMSLPDPNYSNQSTNNKYNSVVCVLAVLLVYVARVLF